MKWIYSDDPRLKKIYGEHRPDFVAHLAAMAAVRYSVQHPLIYGEINVQASMNLMDGSRLHGNPPVVMASTGSLYGSTTPVPFVETAAADRPLAPYPASKRAMELFAYSSHHLFKTPMTVLRFFNVYGPHGRPDMMPWQWTQMILRGETLKLYNMGDLKRDWTYIDDIVAGFVAALDKPFPFEIINLGCGNPVSNIEFVRTLEKVAPAKSQHRRCTHTLQRAANHLRRYFQGLAVCLGMIRRFRWSRVWPTSSNGRRLSGSSTSTDWKATVAEEISPVRTTAVVTIAVAAAGFTLYLARDFFQPIAIGLLLAVVLRPVVRWLERMKVPTGLAATVVVLTLIAGMIVIGLTLSDPIQHWFETAPRSFATAETKINRLRQPLQRLTAVIEKATQEQSATTQPAYASPSKAGSYLAAFFGTTTTLLAQALEVLLLLYFFLSAGDLFLQKLIKISPTTKEKSHVQKTVTDVETAVLRFLLAMGSINFVQGIVVTIVMHFLGVPHPWIWGIFTFVLEFIPYLQRGGDGRAAARDGLRTSFDSLTHILIVPASYMLGSQRSNRASGKPLSHTGSGCGSIPLRSCSAYCSGGFCGACPGRLSPFRFWRRRKLFPTPTIT